MVIRKIHLDSYLKEFVDFCKKRYGKNLIGIGIYGSYAWGYFDKEKSDYDVFLIFNSKIKDETKMLDNQFKKISVQYFGTAKQLSELIREGHWSLYITLLTSAKMFYYSKEYNFFINKLREIDFIKNLKNIGRIKWKAKFDREQLKKGEGYNGAKYALPALRSRLQLLTYIKHKKLIWDLLKIIKLNKDILTLEEQKFLIKLNNSVRKRRNIFYNKEIAVNILNKINKKMLNLLIPAS
ncbi:hypothetical protein A3K74_01160 [Candidatus Pacearchaeota archaeon RBG_13_33_26]|nr:MAG: hypothetical protein A3K74_01160 [Candidatus Pacearchaeota archaeon RBG_13_33_26]